MTEHQQTEPVRARFTPCPSCLLCHDPMAVGVCPVEVATYPPVMDGDQ